MDKKESVNQTRLLIGIAFIIAGIIMIIIAFHTPKVSTGTVTVSLSVTEPTEKETTTLPDYPLDINKATAEELMTIGGLGEHKSKLIVAYREKIGGYTSLNQLTEINGINDNVLKRIAPYLTV